MRKGRLGKNITIYLLIFALVLGFFWFFNTDSDQGMKQIKTSTMINHLKANEVESINVTDTKLTATLEDGSKVYAFVNSVVDLNFIYDEYIIPQVDAGTLKLDSDPPKQDSVWLTLLPTLVMIGIMVAFFVFIMRQNGGGGKAMAFGKSRAKLAKQEDLKKITFKDVAGLKEEKEELEEIVDFLKHPAKYNSLGARIPKGILLVGPPGTGKTYISKATAGEAGVPFFTISGSDFVEMFVGVGASRVRDLFEQAKKNAPCIVFIDEIDAVGRKRGAGLGGGHDEREQTLNQLLVEMDGFAENSGIIILAATNRPDVLDPALLRPGRFDRQIVIGIPDITGREEIFKVHSRNKPLDEGVDPKVLARRTPGFTPADIENMLNEAALLAARRNGMVIRMEEIEEAITKVIAGPEKKSRVISEDERKLTAFHEAGHAVVAHCLPKTDPVHQITIIPRGRAGGFTMILPKEDKYYGTKEEMREQIIHLLGGRAAEKLTLDDISTGASNDIQRATDIAREMVTKYGFSEKLGPVNYSSSEEVFLGKDFTSKQAYSEETANEIDEEVKAIVEEAYDAAITILEEHIDQLRAVAEGLLEIETLDGEQFRALFDGTKTPKELGEDFAAAKKERKVKDKEEAKAAVQKRKEEQQRAKEEAERQAQDRIDELSEMIEKQGKNAKFKPRVMTYNDMTQNPAPVEKKKRPKTDEEELPEAEFKPVENTEPEEAAAPAGPVPQIFTVSRRMTAPACPAVAVVEEAAAPAGPVPQIFTMSRRMTAPACPAVVAAEETAAPAGPIPQIFTVSRRMTAPACPAADKEKPKAKKKTTTAKKTSTKKTTAKKTTTKKSTTKKSTTKESTTKKAPAKKTTTKKTPAKKSETTKEKDKGEEGKDE